MAAMGSANGTGVIAGNHQFGSQMGAMTGVVPPHQLYAMMAAMPMPMNMNMNMNMMNMGMNMNMPFGMSMPMGMGMPMAGAGFMPFYPPPPGLAAFPWHMIQYPPPAAQQQQPPAALPVIQSANHAVSANSDVDSNSESLDTNAATKQ
jgi:hypothetical protein